jgi:putative colanic acid biosynthesis acetyltransferase WcaF
MQYQDLSKFVVPLGFRGRSAILVQLWWLTQATLFRWSPQFAYGFRAYLLRLFGATVGKNVKIRSTATITYPWFFEIGDHSWVGDDSVIYNLASIKIGSNVALAHRVYLSAGSHLIDRVTFDIVARPIVIEDECWLPNDVFVAAGVTIGRGAVIGARSSVFKDMPAGMVCFGYPCMPVKRR